MRTLTSISVWSSAKFVAAYMVVLGSIAGLVYSIGGAVYDLSHSGFNEGTALAFLALIGMPVGFALTGLVIGALLAKPVSWLLAQVGGIELHGD